MGDLVKALLDLFGIGQMEFITAVAFLLFVLPEIFRKKKKEYEYPEIPDTVEEAPPIKIRKFNALYNEEYRPDTERADDSATSFSHISLHSEENNAWQGNLSSTTVYNGYIFSEVLQPPRAYRPANARMRQNVHCRNRRR